MAKRDLPEINAGSMADIAFLLLIFFLVTTTMDTDTGLIRKLPPPPEDEVIPDDIKVKERNIFQILVNSNNQLLVEGEYMDIVDLRAKTVEFIKGKPGDETFPEYKEENLPIWGKTMVSKQIVSLQNDNGTSYETYIKVQNELIAAYRQVRNELAQKKFQKSYAELEMAAKEKGSSEYVQNKVKAIKKFYPQRISEAEPKNIGKK